MTTIPPQLTFYEAAGGEPNLRRIVARFFAAFPKDELLAAVYPRDDT